MVGLESVMGALPTDEKQCDLDPRQLDDDVDCGSYVRRSIQYRSEPGCRVPSYLLVPKHLLTDGGQAPAVLCLHPTDLIEGNRGVVGLADRPNRGYAAELAERGFVCLAPSYPLMADYQPEVGALGWQSGSLKAVWDNLRGLDYLQSLPFTSDSFGVIGHSLGGHNAVFTAIFDPRITTVISSCGLDSFLDYCGGDPAKWTRGEGFCQDRYMPKLAEFGDRVDAIPFDFHELIAALAPRTVLIIAPLRDDNFLPDSVDRVIAAAREVFALHSHPERLSVEHPDCGHDFPVEMRELAYRRLGDDLLRMGRQS